jgi:hypothetical protein
MRTRILQAGLLAALAGGVFFGGASLMDHTLSRHEDVPPDSELVVELTIATRAGVEAGNEEIAEALVVACQLEVRSNVLPDSIETIEEGRYQFVMRPGLDDSDRRQLIGCLQDFRIDNVLANVVSTRQR